MQFFSSVLFLSSEIENCRRPSADILYGRPSDVWLPELKIVTEIILLPPGNVRVNFSFSIPFHFRISFHVTDRQADGRARHAVRPIATTAEKCKKNNIQHDLLWKCHWQSKSYVHIGILKQMWQVKKDLRTFYSTLANVFFRFRSKGVLTSVAWRVSSLCEQMCQRSAAPTTPYNLPITHSLQDRPSLNMHFRPGVDCYQLNSKNE